MTGKRMNSIKPKMEIVLLLAKRNKRTKELELRLADYFCEVRLVSDLGEMAMLPSNNHFAVIVVTDSFGLELNIESLFALKSRYPCAKILCLVDEISQGIEAVIRSVGPVFLGSYDQFFRFFKDIISSAVESRKRT